MAEETKLTSTEEAAPEEFNAEAVETTMEKKDAKHIPSLDDTIVCSPAGVFTSNPISIATMANIFLAALTEAVKQAREQYTKEDNAKEIDKSLFDELNNAYSKQLEIAFPDYELHPEMTEKVIKEVLDKEKDKTINMAKHRGKKKTK